MKRAIINLADTGACESTAYMLEQVGYEVRRPDPALITELRHFGLENVLDSESMQKDWGYDTPRVPATAAPADMFHADLFIDTKGHTNYGKIIANWPNLMSRVLWCCLNGGDPHKRKEPEWAKPPCPVLTNNQWCYGIQDFYTCFPPYRRMAERVRRDITGPAICLIHNAERWGYGAIVPILREHCGVRFYGTNSPDGLLQHQQAMQQLSSAPFMLHAKIGDTMAYAVVEAIASLVPIVCTQFYIDECRLGELLEPGVTCLTFDPLDAVESVTRIKVKLYDKDYNLRLARAALARYADLQWKDVEGFAKFMERNFG